MGTEEDGVEIDENTIVGIVKTKVLEKRLEKPFKYDTFPGFKMIDRIVFLPFGEYQKGMGYGLQYILRKRVPEFLYDLGISHPKEVGTFILESISLVEGEVFERCGVMVPDGYPIYRVKVNSECVYFKLILSIKGGIMDIRKTYKGIEYFNRLGKKIHNYTIKGF